MPVPENAPADIVPFLEMLPREAHERRCDEQGRPYDGLLLPPGAWVIRDADGAFRMFDPGEAAEEFRRHGYAWSQAAARKQWGRARLAGFDRLAAGNPAKAGFLDRVETNVLGLAGQRDEPPFPLVSSLRRLFFGAPRVREVTRLAADDLARELAADLYEAPVKNGEGVAELLGRVNEVRVFRARYRGGAFFVVAACLTPLKAVLGAREGAPEGRLEERPLSPADAERLQRLCREWVARTGKTADPRIACTVAVPALGQGLQPAEQPAAWLCLWEPRPQPKAAEVPWVDRQPPWPASQAVRNFLERLRPLTWEEKRRRVRETARRMIQITGQAQLEDVVRETGYRKSVVRRVFEELESEKGSSFVMCHREEKGARYLCLQDAGGGKRSLGWRLRQKYWGRSVYWYLARLFFFLAPVAVGVIAALMGKTTTPVVMFGILCGAEAAKRILGWMKDTHCED